MNMLSEEVVLIGRDRSIVGVYTAGSGPAGSKSDFAVICITAGLVHHVGPHRMHVLLARSLSEIGISALRFDLSGIGDSAPRTDDLSADEAHVQEIKDAISELKQRSHSRIILFGVCSGALNAAKAAFGNTDIAGLVLVNSESGTSSAEVDPEIAAQLYLRHSLWNLKSWKNLLTGKVRVAMGLTT